MSEFVDVLRQFDRMCRYYQRKHECPMGCPMSGVNISQCRKIAFECPDSVERTIMAWAAEHPVVYPTWEEWLITQGVINEKPNGGVGYRYPMPKLFEPIPADIAEKLGIEPKEWT